MNIRQRHFIKHTEIKQLKEEIIQQYDEVFFNKLFPKKANVEYILAENDDEFYAINNDLKLWKSKKEGYIPVLTQLLEEKIVLKKVVVDMGAVKFLTLNKADVMRPGITKIDPSIKKDDIIQIIDETHGRALAVGKALFSAKEMQEKKKGKVIINLHTINDDVWKLAKLWDK
ncbi:MAG: RNA-binding protein [Promethearchaeota archaeon]|nr:MAG: RNA-binding protein [Candidatus Lokiarchaeota archaeon]